MYNILQDLMQTERIAVSTMFNDNQEWSYYTINDITISVQARDDFNPLTTDLIKSNKHSYNNIVVRIPKLGELIIFQDYFNDGIYGVEDLSENFIVPSTQRSSIGILYSTSIDSGEICFITKYKTTIHIRRLFENIDYSIRDIMSTISNKHPTNFSFVCDESKPYKVIDLIIKIYKYTDDSFTINDTQELLINTGLRLIDVMRPSRLERLGFLNKLTTCDFDRINRLPQLMVDKYNPESYYLCPKYLIDNGWDYSSKSKTWIKDGIELCLSYGMSYILPNYDEVWTSTELNNIILDINNK